MSASHHPAEALLVDYASGALRGGGRMVLSSHLMACPACRDSIARFEAVGGALLSALPPATLHKDALALALARIERPVPPAPATTGPIAGWITTPADVVRAARDRRRWAAPGVWVASVTRGPGRASTYLLGVAAGMTVPRHTHRGAEMVCVLKGAYVDDDVRHAPGDFAFNDDSVDHRPGITAEGDCVCLVFTEAPLVPRDWVGRLFQPLVGI